MTGKRLQEIEEVWTGTFGRTEAERSDTREVLELCAALRIEREYADAMLLIADTVAKAREKALRATGKAPNTVNMPFVALEEWRNNLRMARGEL